MTENIEQKATEPIRHTCNRLPNWFGLVSILSAFSVGWIYCNKHNEDSSKKLIPRKYPIEEGYVDTKKLTIEAKDANWNGRNEVYLNYGNRSYLLRLDEQGNPVVQNYEYRGPQIVSKDNLTTQVEKLEGVRVEKK